MLFNTIDFVIFFLAVLTVLVIMKNRKFQLLFLLAASYFFFYYTSNYLIFLLVISTVLDFFVGKEIWNSTNLRRKKVLLSLSLIGNLSLLGAFKYADFAILSFNFLGNYLDFSNDIPLLNLILPIGISFYTFQTISYTADIYRGKLKPSKSFWEFAFFVTFFPQLIAGPIVRATEFLPQLREKLDNFKLGSRLRQIQIHNSNLKLGITIMALGFLKKMFFGDNIAPMVNDIFSQPIGLESFTIILGSFGFLIQLYGDFSGYSDIAIGAALILGFKLPLNFNHPFFAHSPSNWIRRWHITLFAWFRDYVYIPLGGSKKGKGRTYLNLFLVMLIAGLWHGASWNFAVWGTLIGVYLAAERIIANSFPNLKNSLFFKNKFILIISIFVTQYLIMLSVPAFRISDVDGMIFAMGKMIFWDFAIENTLEIILNHKLPVFLIGTFVIFEFIFFKVPKLIEKIASARLIIWGIFLIGITLLIMVFYDASPDQFIYFRF